MSDPVNHPAHYATHPSGVEVIEITRHLNFNVGNAVKYICRHNLKGKPQEDLQKAAWYIQDEIERYRDHVGGKFEKFPTEAAVKLSAYLAVEEYLIKHSPDKATLSDQTVSALELLSMGFLAEPKRLVTDAQEELA